MWAIIIIVVVAIILGVAIYYTSNGIGYTVGKGLFKKSKDNLDDEEKPKYGDQSIWDKNMKD